jgi:hypothetical protein
MEAFFEGIATDEPSDAAFAIAGYLFSQYGSGPFTLQEVRDVADVVGLTIPKRIDMTYASATKDGKALYRKASRGKVAPTVHGELHIRETYGVKKGKKKRTSDGS